MIIQNTLENIIIYLSLPDLHAKSNFVFLVPFLIHSSVCVCAEQQYVIEMYTLNSNSTIYLFSVSYFTALGTEQILIRAHAK